MRIGLALALPLVLMLPLAACGGDSDPFPTVTPEVTFPVEFAVTPFDPLEKRREGVFPVNLVLPLTDVSVWTTVRREGDPEQDDELTFVVEGYVEARESFFHDYRVTISDNAGNSYAAQPSFALGLLAPGDLRKFELSVDMPKDVRVTEIHFESADGESSRDLIYHIDLQLARIPTTPLLPERWQDAE
jgi:hypothetical protein